MSFNATSTLLCVSSATETVHLFKLSANTEQTSTPPSPEARNRRPSLHSASSMTESQMTEDRPSSPDANVADRAHNGTFAGMIRRTSQTVGKSFAAKVGGYLPTAFSEMLEPTRDFAWFKVPRMTNSGSGTVKSVVAMSSNTPQVMVVTSEGSFLTFNIDLEKGGEGTLTKQNSVLESGERPRQPLVESP